MRSKSKFATAGSAARRRAAISPVAQALRVDATAEDWEQRILAPNEFDDDGDYRRIVQGDGGRSLPLYNDDYN